MSRDVISSASHVITSPCQALNPNFDHVMFNVNVPAYYGEYVLPKAVDDGHQLILSNRGTSPVIIRNLNFYEQVSNIVFNDPSNSQTVTILYTVRHGWQLQSKTGNAIVEHGYSRPQFLYAHVTYRNSANPTAPDRVAVISTNPRETRRGRIVSYVHTSAGDELRIGGAFRQPGTNRLVLYSPGMASSHINVIDSTNKRYPNLTSIIPANKVKCLGLANLRYPVSSYNGDVIVTALNNQNGDIGAGLVLIRGSHGSARLSRYDQGQVPHNYDAELREARNYMITTGFTNFNTFDPGFNAADVVAGRYASEINMWDFACADVVQRVDANRALPGGGLAMLPIKVMSGACTADIGYTASLLSGSYAVVHRDPSKKCSCQKFGSSANHGRWRITQFGKAGRIHGYPQMPASLVLSADNKYLYIAHYLAGHVTQFDVSSPLRPKFVSRIWLGGYFLPPPKIRGVYLTAGPAFVAISRDGEQLYATNSFYSAWDNQFYCTDGLLPPSTFAYSDKGAPTRMFTSTCQDDPNIEAPFGSYGRTTFPSTCPPGSACPGITASQAASYAGTATPPGCPPAYNRGPYNFNPAYLTNYDESCPSDTEIFTSSCCNSSEGYCGMSCDEAKRSSYGVSWSDNEDCGCSGDTPSYDPQVVPSRRSRNCMCTRCMTGYDIERSGMPPKAQCPFCNGSQVVRIHTGIRAGVNLGTGMQLDCEFLVNFGAQPDGPAKVQGLVLIHADD